MSLMEYQKQIICFNLEIVITDVQDFRFEATAQDHRNTRCAFKNERENRVMKKVLIPKAAVMFDTFSGTTAKIAQTGHLAVRRNDGVTEVRWKWSVSTNSRCCGLGPQGSDGG